MMVVVFPVSAVAETTAETDASLMAVTTAETETDVTTNEACEIDFFISHASFYFYCRCALDSNFLKNSK